jgi:hypothetical protein
MHWTDVLDIILNISRLDKRVVIYAPITIEKNAETHEIFLFCFYYSLLSLFKKIKIGLCDPHAVCVSCVSPYQLLNG